MNRPGMRFVAVLGVCAVAATACSGGDDVAGETTTLVSTASTESTVSTVATVPETTVAATTAPEPTPPSTEASTTSSTTEVVAPTTDQPVDTTLPEGVPPRVTFPDAPELQAVVDAYYIFSDDLSVLLADPTDQAALQAVLRHTIDPLSERIDGIALDLVESGEAYRPNPDQASYLEIYAFTVFALDDLATFDGCSVDADIHVAVGAGEGGTDSIVDDSISSSLLTYQLNRVEGAWRFSDITRVNRWENVIGCDG